MPSKDNAVDRLYVSSNQRKQTVLTSYTSTEKMFLLQCKEKYWKKENIILKFLGRDTGVLIWNNKKTVTMSVHRTQIRYPCQ
jgi:hypothetical protein